MKKCRRNGVGEHNEINASDDRVEYEHECEDIGQCGGEERECTNEIKTMRRRAERGIL